VAARELAAERQELTARFTFSALSDSGRSSAQNGRPVMNYGTFSNIVLRRRAENFCRRRDPPIEESGHRRRSMEMLLARLHTQPNVCLSRSFSRHGGDCALLVATFPGRVGTDPAQTPADPARRSVLDILLRGRAWKNGP